jgi:hypothetical protein
MWNASVSAFVVNQSKVSTEDLLSLCGAHWDGAGDPGAFMRLMVLLGNTRKDAITDFR